MSFEVTTAHNVTYRNNMELALQQKRPKLAIFALRDNCSGEKAEIKNLLGAVKRRKKQGRHDDLIPTNTPHSRRWIAMPEESYFLDYVDSADRLASGIDIQGGYVMNGAATLARAWDDEFLAGYYGVNLTGKEGATQTPFKSANIVPVDVGATAATGLNLAKLLAAREIYRAAHVDLDEEELFVALTSAQETNLLKELQVTSLDFRAKTNGETVIENGKIGKILGFMPVLCEIGSEGSFDNAALTLSGSNRRVPTWCKSGMVMGVWQEGYTSIDRLPQKGQTTQVYASSTIAACRTDEDKCVQILCSE